jgi:hypothetical protein
MNKKEIVWLIIRLIGLYFAYLSIVTLFTVIGSAPALIFMPPALGEASNANTAVANTRVQTLPYNVNPIGEPMPKTNTETAASDKDRSEIIKIFLWYIFLTAIYGAVGWYLLRDGRLFYSLLMREDLIKKREAEPEVTTLNL